MMTALRFALIWIDSAQATIVIDNPVTPWIVHNGGPTVLSAVTHVATVIPWDAAGIAQTPRTVDVVLDLTDMTLDLPGTWSRVDLVLDTPVHVWTSAGDAWLPAGTLSLTESAAPAEYLVVLSGASGILVGSLP